MKIYTSYYAMLDKQPSNLQPIAISRGTYRWNADAQRAPRYWPLAPDKKLHRYAQIREGDGKPPVDSVYRSIFKRQLETLDPHAVIIQLHDIVDTQWNDPTQCEGMLLYCFERPEDGCHRHLVAAWLREHGYYCTELVYSEKQAARYPDHVQTKLL